MDFFDKTGRMAIGSRLRILTDRVTADAAKIYQLYGVDIKPKWFPVLFVLSSGEAKTITNIAREIGQTHPSVSTIVKELINGKLAKETADKTDKRRTVIVLSTRGKAICKKLVDAEKDVSVAVEGISKATRNDLWHVICEWENQLSEKSLLERVKEARKERESHEVRIVPYEPRYQPIFRALNEQWITKYWQLEPHDIECLDHPQENIIDRGGFIFVALYREEPIGVCALCLMDDPKYDYELSKLAISPTAQGKGIGTLLCKTVIGKAKEIGAKNLFLESNTLLKPAIQLYKKMGFRELSEFHPAYARGDIQMELFF